MSKREAPTNENKKSEKKSLRVKARRPVVVVASKRIPFYKSGTLYEGMPLRDLATPTFKALLQDLGLEGERLGEVALGSLIKAPSERGLARDVVLEAGLDPHTPAVDLERACGTGLEAVLMIANKIALGQIECGIGAGVDTNSNVPLLFSKNLSDFFKELRKSSLSLKSLQKLQSLRPKDFVPDFPRVVERRTGLSMGEHCEQMVKEWKVSREDQDRWAWESHQKASRSYEAGFQSDLVISFKNSQRDGILRPDTTLEKLGKLKSVFDPSPAGTLTAGNSTALTDGAAAVFLASEDYAEKHELPVLAYFRDARAWGVDFVEAKEGLLMAPTYAVADMLGSHQLSFDDFRFVEIHEAFAGQVLCTLEAWKSADYCRDRLKLKGPMGEPPRDRINVYGSSLAYGHPFSATGARITGLLAKALGGKKGELGLISICTAGGMGVAAILEGA